MSTDFHTKTPMNQLPEPAREIARQATDVTEETAHRATVAVNDVIGAVKDATTDVTDAAKDAFKTLSSKVEEGVERTKEYAQHAVDATKDAGRDMYQSAALKAEDTLASSKEYVRQNPVLVVVGALTFGAAIGCMLMMARRQPTTCQRYVDEPWSPRTRPFSPHWHPSHNDFTRDVIRRGMAREEQWIECIAFTRDAPLTPYPGKSVVSAATSNSGKP